MSFYSLTKMISRLGVRMHQSTNDGELKEDETKSLTHRSARRRLQGGTNDCSTRSVSGQRGKVVFTQCGIQQRIRFVLVRLVMHLAGKVVFETVESEE